jgi:hypothetical protein
MAKRLRFDTGGAGVDASLQRLAALADPHAAPVADGLALEDWLEDVMRQIRCLPEDLRRSLKPEALYCWDAPRRWNRLHAIDWHSRAAAGLMERLTAISRQDAEDNAPITLSSAMRVTHDYRHSLQEGLRALHPIQVSLPQPMLEQVARIEVTHVRHEAAVAESSLAHGTSL